MGNLRREVIFRDREAEVGEEEEEKKHVAKEEEGRPGPLSLSLQIGLNGKRRNMLKKQKKDKQVPLSSVMISANVFFNKDGRRVARRPLLFLVFSIKLSVISLQLCLCQSLEIFYVNDQHWSS